MATNRIDYTQRQLVEGIRRVGIELGDVVSLQVSLGRLGLPEGARTIQDISRIVVAAFEEVLGPSGTLVVPTYSYSIGRNEIFDVEATPSTIGEFTEYFRMLPGVQRSRDPMLSSAARGAKATEIVRGISTSCYGAGSVFDRLRQHGAKICTLGVSLHWATYRHYIEEAAGVPFRFKKRFSGMIREAGHIERESWIYFAAPFLENCAPNGLPLEKAAVEEGLVRVALVGRGELMAIDAREYFDFGLQQLKNDPWLTAKGPPCDLAQMLWLEDRRIGAPLLPGPAESASPAALAETIASLCRDPISPGIDATFAFLTDCESALRIHCFRSGAEIAGNIVPEKWWCRHAVVSKIEEVPRELLGIGASSVVPYSKSFCGEVSAEELLAHCSVPFTGGAPSRLPECPDTLPWQLALSRAQLDTIREGIYRIEIDAVSAFGVLKAAEMRVITGNEDGPYILLVARLDQRCGDLIDVFGTIVGLSVMQELKKRSHLPVGIRLLVIASPLALSAWINENPDKLEQCRWAASLDELIQSDRLQRRDLMTLPKVLGAALVADEARALLLDAQSGYRFSPHTDFMTALRQSVMNVESEIYRQ
jgi:aminoglycoside N3'-acetyltransferase